MKEISDKVTKTPSTYWAYYITGISVLFSLVTFLVLFRVSNDIQIERAKQIASTGLEYRAELLDTAIGNQLQILRAFNSDLGNVLKIYPETFPELIPQIFANQVALTGDQDPVGLILFGKPPVEMPVDGYLHELRSHWNVVDSVGGDPYQIFAPYQLKNGRWFIYIRQPIQANQNMGMVDTAVEISQLVQPFQLATVDQIINIQLTDKDGTVLIGNEKC